MFRQGMYLVSQSPLDLLSRLPEIECLTLIMVGEEDILVPLSVEKKINENISNSELILIPKAGHMPMIEKSEETSTAVKEFFKKNNIK